MSKIEVLSPVGKPETLVAAVRSGCDAVYLGGVGFNARRSADNFNKEQLKQGVEYCHKNGVKVYFALNISVLCDEIQTALNEADLAAECGVDAFIVADLGLARCLHHRYKNIPLHGSTQMSVSSYHALPILSELGFSRIVVAREMSKKDLEQFCLKAKEYNIEVEVFVHGALCMCLSGQCYMSAFLGSRSGNRGLCAGPCRLPFGQGQTGDEYALSLKDLSLLDHIQKLGQMGVASLKIEGRLKRPEYVAAVTKAVRDTVDNGFCEEKTKVMLRDVFSRSGFTDGYFTDRVNSDMFGVRTKDDILTSKAIQNKIHDIYRNECQRVGLAAKISLKSGENAQLTFFDGQNTVTAFGSQVQQAINTPADCDYLKKQLSKLGGTPYFLRELECEIDSGVTLASARLSDLRRTAVQLLDDCRTKLKPLQRDCTLPENINRSRESRLKGTLVRLDNINSVELKDIKAEGIILPLDTDFSKIHSVDIPLYLEMPRAFCDGEQVRRQLSLASKYVSGAFCHTLAAIQLCKELSVNPIGGFGLNVYNTYTADVLNKLGLEAFTVSFETKYDNSLKIKTPLKKGAVVYGALPLMIFKNCPAKSRVGCKNCKRSFSLTDRIGEKFPLLCRFGYTELYNSRPVYLADDNQINADFNILYFTTETNDEILDIIDRYNKKLPSQNKYTRGLYKKGVL